MNRRAVPVVLLLLLVVPPSVPVADASSPPQLVCGVCGPGFTYAAHERGVPLTIERSELTVRVDEGGTGHWNASVVVDDAAARRFRQDPSILDAIVKVAMVLGGAVLFHLGWALAGTRADGV